MSFRTLILFIPYSNSYLERMYSFVNIIKSQIRNQLKVGTVSEVLQVKLYYDDDDTFESDEDH